jgi:hypothetical protein
MEEARIYTYNSKLTEAAKILGANSDSNIKQIATKASVSFPPRQAFA